MYTTAKAISKILEQIGWAIVIVGPIVGIIIIIFAVANYDSAAPGLIVTFGSPIYGFLTIYSAQLVQMFIKMSEDVAIIRNTTEKNTLPPIDEK
jgi:uncharacterized integral membrane protein